MTTSWITSVLFIILATNGPLSLLVHPINAWTACTFASLPRPFFDRNNTVNYPLECTGHRDTAPLQWLHNGRVISNASARTCCRLPDVVKTPGWERTVWASVADLVILENPPPGIYCCLSNLSLCLCWDLTVAPPTPPQPDLEGSTDLDPVTSASGPSDEKKPEGDVVAVLVVNPKFYLGLGLALVLLACLVGFFVVELR